MPRRPDTPGKPRVATLRVRLTSDGMAAVDDLRGQRTRSEYIRALIKADATRRKK